MLKRRKYFLVGISMSRSEPHQPRANRSDPTFYFRLLRAEL